MNEFPRTLKIATVWGVIGVAVFLGFSALEHQQSQSRFHVSGSGSIELKRGPDGHYHWPGSINGEPVDFLVDTGATGTAISKSLARKLGLAPVRQVRSDTAGGEVVGALVRADVVLQGGVRMERAWIAALPALGDKPLLGMDVLGKLHWQQRDGLLVIEKKDGER